MASPVDAAAVALHAAAASPSVVAMTRPRRLCPACGKLIAVSANGRLHAHKDGERSLRGMDDPEECAGSWTKPPIAAPPTPATFVWRGRERIWRAA